MRLKLAAILAPFAALPLASQEAPRAYELGEVETRPGAQNVAEFTAALAALYPAALRDSAIGGTAQVSFVIGADGAVRDAVAVDATRPEFGAAAVEAVGVLRFTPATVDGAPVAVRVTQPVEWTAEPPPAAEPPRERAPLPAALLRLLAADPELAALAADAVELADVSDPPRLRNAGMLAQILSREYPPALRDAGLGGRVVVRFIIDREGVPHLVGVLSTTDPQFAEPTLRAVRALRFAPARRDGEPIPMWTELPIEWTVAR